MLERRMIDWLSHHSDTLQVRHNAHREADTTVARHLLHRERLGDVIQFDDMASRAACIESQNIWELSVRHFDGTETHVAAPTFDACLKLAKSLLGPSIAGAIAA